MPRQRLARRINVAVAWWALAVAAVDLVSKWWAREHLTTPRHVAGPLWLRLTYNSGISFSLDHSNPAVTTAITLGAVLVVALIGLRASPGLPTAGFGLLLGGGISNEVDRLSRTPHRVTDFIAAGSFPVFNLADVAVTLGSIVLLVSLLRSAPVVQR